MRYIGLYLAAIVAANLIVAHYGAWVSPLTAFAFVGFDLVARDHLHEAWKGRALLPKMAALVVVGSVLSYLLNRDVGTIALASTAAFAVAATADGCVYAVLGGRQQLVRVNGSNAVSGVLDSVIFPTVAFGVFLPWVIMAQSVAKVGGGFLWSVVLHKSCYGR